jgi:hypothetical protein
MSGRFSLESLVFISPSQFGRCKCKHRRASCPTQQYPDSFSFDYRQRLTVDILLILLCSYHVRLEPRASLSFMLTHTDASACYLDPWPTIPALTCRLCQHSMQIHSTQNVQSGHLHLPPISRRSSWMVHPLLMAPKTTSNISSHSRLQITSLEAHTHRFISSTQGSQILEVAHLGPIAGARV